MIDSSIEHVFITHPDYNERIQIHVSALKRYKRDGWVLEETKEAPKKAVKKTTKKAASENS